MCSNQLDSTENEEASDGVLVRLQSQQMLDQIQADEPLQASGTGPVDGAHDSSESEGDPGDSEEKLSKLSKLVKIRNARIHLLNENKTENESDTVQNGNSHILTSESFRIRANTFDIILDESGSRRSPYEDDEQEDDNDTNITDDEDNVDVVIIDDLCLNSIIFMQFLILYRTIITKKLVSMRLDQMTRPEQILAD